MTTDETDRTAEKPQQGARFPFPPSAVGATPPAMDALVKEQIERAIEKHEVILFMKGTRTSPSCGFSARTVEMLDALLFDYATVDVLAHPEVRDGIKEYSSWPTIPQLYVRGKFVGGADIVTELFEGGQLAAALGVEETPEEPPEIRITDRAAKAFQGFISGSGEVVLLSIDRAFSPTLSVGPRPEKGFVVAASGVDVAVDRLSAGRANGITIDFIETPEGQAFKIDNPNEPKDAVVQDLSAVELDALRKSGAPHRLIDVRTPGEWETARIQGAELLDADLMDRLRDLPKDTKLVFQCHHGHRSLRAAEQFVPLGFTALYNLTGGIDAWSQSVDASVPRY